VHGLHINTNKLLPARYLIAVVSRLERTLHWDTDVVGLVLGELSELDTQRTQVKTGDLLVQVLGEDVDLSALVLVSVLVSPQLNLSQGLVGERRGHDERRVTSGATQVQQTSLSQDDDTVTIREDELVNLRLDVLAGGGLVQVLHVDFVIEVTNVTNDGVVLHLGHVGGHDDVLVTGGGDEDITDGDDGLQTDNRETFHGGLQGADGVNLSDVDDGTGGLHGLGATLSDVTVTADDSALTGDHDVSGTAKTIGKRVLATVQVVELGLGDGVVDVDGREKQLTLLGHDVKSVHTSGGLLRDTNHALGQTVPLAGVLGELTSKKSQDNLELSVLGGVRVRKRAILGVLLLGLDTLVDKKGHVSTVIDDEVTAVSLGILRPGDGVEGALPVLLKSLALPGKDSGRAVTSDGSGSVVLGGEDVATAPSDLGTKSLQGLDKDSGLDGHVKGTRDTSTSEELRAIFTTASHQTRHLMLGKFDFLATEVSKRDISNAIITRGHFVEKE